MVVKQIVGGPRRGDICFYKCFRIIFLKYVMNAVVKLKATDLRSFIVVTFLFLGA